MVTLAETTSEHKSRRFRPAGLCDRCVSALSVESEKSVVKGSPVSRLRTPDCGSATGVTTTYTYKPDTNYVQEVKTTNIVGTVLTDDSYAYRADGLKMGATESTLNANGSSDTVTLAWNYDGLDRLTSETSSDTAGVAALNYTDGYKYDLDSNRTTETIENGSGTVTDTTTSTYNADNQLTQSVDANNGTTVFSYDLDGNQIGTVHTPSGSTTPDSTTTNEYTLQGKLAGIQNKNGSGTITSSATYKYGFGNALGFTPSTAITQYLYTQQYYDLASNTYYDWARNYDPATGLFDQADYGYSGSLANPMSGLPYIYGGGDPINMLDLNGHDFGISDSLAAVSISTMIDSVEVSVYSAALSVSQGVAAGETARQIETGFIIGQVLGLGALAGFGVLGGL